MFLNFIAIKIDTVMNNLGTFAFANMQFSQILILVVFLLLVGLAIYQLVSFWKKGKDESIYY